MAQDQDDDQKTEEPTDKRLRDAEERGDVPRARDVGLLAAMAGAWLIVAVAAPGAVASMAEVLLPFIENPDDIRLDGSPYDVLGGLRQLLSGAAVAMLPVFGLLALAALASALGQGPLVIAPTRIEPKLSHLSPLGGWRRIVSRAALFEFLKSLAKLMAIAGAAWLAVAPCFGSTEGSVGVDAASLPDLLRDVTLRLLLAVLLATVLIAAIDVLWNRLEWRRRLRMTFQEVKDEYKQVEGDPHLKARLRDLRRQKSRRRMMANVPRAAVVLTNPTHYAVALEYERGRTPAPLCVAKGADLMALRIRSLAEAHNIPIVENPPLARALYASAELDELIPVQHYQAVAEVMMYVLRLKEGVRRSA